VVIFLSLAGSYFNSILLDAPFHIRQELPFMSRWLVWMLLTPVAVSLAKKLNYAENTIGRFFVYHFSVYMLLCAVHVFLASITATLINALLHQPANYYVILKKCALTGVFFNFIVYGVILLMLNGIEYYKALQGEKTKTAELERSLVDTRLQFLKQQLQPHFLFNTHHSIITLIKMGENNKAAVMLEQLSDLLRIALREANDIVLPLRKEIETLQLYIDIQQTRYENKMVVVYEIETESLDALVPGMILQPLVENSIKYAVERSSSVSTITVKAGVYSGDLKLTIKDTGSEGISEQEIKKGTGLSNTIERLNKLYDHRYFFSIHPNNEDNNRGTEVTITMPLQYASV